MVKEQFLGGNYQYTKHCFSYFLESMKRLGISHIELYGAAPHLYLYDYPIGRVYELKRQIRDAGMTVECFTAEQCNYPISMAIEDEIVRERSLQYYEKALEAAAVLEVPYMQMISGGGLIGSKEEENWKRAADGFYRIVKQAEKLGVTILLEADFTCTVKNTADACRMLKEIDSPAFSGLLDTNTIYFSNDDFEESVKALGDDLRHLHFIDAKKPDLYCLIPGTGDIPLKEYAGILDKYGYKGYLTPELWGWQYVDMAQKAMEESLKFCRSLCKEGTV